MSQENDFLMDDESAEFFENIKKLPREQMMELVYESIMTNRQAALKSESSRDEKINAINFLIAWYESKEEYEKCKELKNILKEL
jgi:hypothetical protein